MARCPDASLYGIIDLGYLSEDAAVGMAKSLLEGGVGVLQLRAKDYRAEDLLTLALTLRDLCELRGVPFVVNDHLQLAKDCRAHGLHLGQGDGPLDVARSELGPEVLIGRSTHSVAQAHAAREEGADYIGFGPLFPTPTKEGRPGIGLADIAQVEDVIGKKIPVFCIGGIKRGNLEAVLSSGARRVVVVSHLLLARDPSREARELISLIKKQAN